MPEETLRPTEKRSRRFFLYLVVLAAVYLLGFVPMWRKAQAETALREKAEHALTVTRIVKDLGSAAIDARRGAYEPARQGARTFFLGAQFEIEKGDQSDL